MNIDTQTIRRLRDALVANGRLTAANSDTVEIESQSQASLQRVAPFAETMYLMMMVDGKAATEEREAIRGALQMLTHGLLNSNSLDDILRRCETVVQEFGVERRLQAIGAQLSADRLDRETAFTLAAVVAMADKQVLESESLLVQSIAEWYGVSSSRCRVILQSVEGRS